MWVNKWLFGCVSILLFSTAAIGQEDGVADLGKQLYEENCASCHQFDGGGVPMMQPSLIGSERANGPVGGVIEMIFFGSAAVPMNMSDYSNEMPAFDFLTNGEIATLATYVRTNFENEGGSVSADDVAARRTP